MFHQMPQFGENQFPAGKFAGIQTARYANNDRIFNDTGRGVRLKKPRIQSRQVSALQTGGRNRSAFWQTKDLSLQS
jgi:hypothetical protein